MIPKANALKGMFIVLWIFLSLLIYKALVYGRREAFLFMP